MTKSEDQGARIGALEAQHLRERVRELEAANNNAQCALTGIYHACDFHCQNQNSPQDLLRETHKLVRDLADEALKVMKGGKDD